MKAYPIPIQPALVLAAVFGLTVMSSAQEAPAPAPAIADIQATIKTSKGAIKVVILASKAPVTAANFLNLAKRGNYDGVTFHRVAK